MESPQEKESWIVKAGARQSIIQAVSLSLECFPLFPSLHHRSIDQQTKGRVHNIRGNLTSLRMSKQLIGMQYANE
jgi:hypothetical protein